MSYTTPTLRSTGNLITASIYNTDIISNVIAIVAGLPGQGFALTDFLGTSGGGAPAVSAAGHAIVYYDTVVGGLVASLNGGAYTPVRAPLQAFRGLVLRTHQDNDKAANQIALLGLDEVILSSGIRYTGLTLPLTADITVSGAGGLDTGARTASKWYEVWLAGKSDGNAANLTLLFHRAKERNVDQSYTTAPNGQLGLLDTTYTRIATTFTPGTTGLLEHLDLQLVKTGAPAYNFWVTIEADAAGSPSGTPLATSDKMLAANISTSDQTVTFVFRSPASLTSGTKYWIVLRGDGAGDNANKISWADNSGGSNAQRYNGAAWSSVGVGLWFKEYVTVANGALTYPAGYTDSCKIGYVYNSGSNALIGFLARDRIMLPLTSLSLGTIATNIRTLTDLSGLVPPCPVGLVCSYGNTTDGALGFVGGAPDGIATGTGDRWGGESCVGAPSTDGSNANIVCAEVFTEMQACYLGVSAGTGQFWVNTVRWTD